MKKLFLLPTVRYDLMKKLVDSWKACPLLADWKWAVTFQEYTHVQRGRIAEVLGDALVYERGYDFRASPYLTRSEIYKHVRSEFEVFCSIDDDMQFIPQKTDFAKAVEKCLLPDVGVVSCNWVRFDTPALWARVRQEEKFLKQPLVNMSGGMVYSGKVIDAVFQYPLKPYIFCDIQLALVSYLQGYENYRYLGSVLVHSVMVKDGLKKLYAQRDMDIPDERFLGVIPASSPTYKGTTNNWYMPKSSQLTLEAHIVHELNKEKLQNGEL